MSTSIEKNQEADFDFDFSHLNDMQRQAVMTTDGALLLLAGAGSGKTTVLMNRIANLLVNKGVKPYEIIAITFTNKAAGEMKERLARMNIPGAGDVWASTFHSACVRFLRRDIDKLGYSKSFAIYDTADSAALMKRILKEQDIDEKQLSHKTVLNYISRAKDELKSASDYMRQAERAADPYLMNIAEAYREYEKRLKKSDSLDFDDLIMLTVKLFREYPDVLEGYQKRFKYVLVDEYQDTNKLQYLLTSALAGGHGNICVVGDDDQSIYKFRGATIDNILSFEKNFKDARVIRLEQNYRSTGAILKAANEVIKNNIGRKGKNLWTEKEDGKKPALYIVSDERDEARFVADEILAGVKEKRKWSEHVILYRMNAQSNQFETAFKRSGIPYRIYGGVGFFDRAEIKDMLAYLCVIHNLNDDVRLLRIINTPARGLGDTTIARLLAVAEELGVPVFEAIKYAHEYENLISAAPKLNKFAQMIHELRELAESGGLDELYDELIRKTGYIRMLEEKKSDENLSRIDNVRELKTNIINFMTENGNSLFDFLSETALYTDLDRDDQSTDKVMLMTMHSAKGLEFDTVFIVGAEEGIFPSWRVTEYPDEMEEERRLCYVAMTRAMRRLCFTAAQFRTLHGRSGSNNRSRFLSEISSSNLEIYDIAAPGAWSGAGTRNPWQTQPGRATGYSTTQSSYTQPTFSAPGRNNTARPYAPRPAVPRPQQPVRPNLTLNPGDNIEHKAFGRGIIKNISPAGGDALLEIDFQEHGTKRLLKNSAAPYITVVGE